MQNTLQIIENIIKSLVLAVRLRHFRCVETSNLKISRFPVRAGRLLVKDRQTKKFCPALFTVWCIFYLVPSAGFNSRDHSPFHPALLLILVALLISASFTLISVTPAEDPVLSLTLRLQPHCFFQSWSCCSLCHLHLSPVSCAYGQLSFRFQRWRLQGGVSRFIYIMLTNDASNIVCFSVRLCLLSVCRYAVNIIRLIGLAGAPVVPPCRILIPIRTIVRCSAFFRFYEYARQNPLYFIFLYLVLYLWRYAIVLRTSRRISSVSQYAPALAFFH